MTTNKGMADMFFHDESDIRLSNMVALSASALRDSGTLGVERVSASG
ncbi:MAG: hypothetical protein ACYC21_07170 [Eubacteriales bacterium]